MATWEEKVRAAGCGLMSLGCLIPVLIFALMIAWGAIIGGKYSDEIYAVESTVLMEKRNLSTFKAAPLDGGVAVMNTLGWAYWVKDGRVYAANGLAMGASPSCPVAPVGIGYSEIQDAVFPK